jgi:hypothetical protein
MDRISALRNVEEALAAFEDGEVALADLERRVQGILRTYATEFEGQLSAYRATGGSRVEGMVVLAPDEQTARERVRTLLTDAGESVDGPVELVVEPVDSAGDTRT